jgi:hypothetical protein
VKPEPISLPMPEGSELLVNPDPSARVHVQEVGDRTEQFAAFVDSVGPYLLHTAELLCGDKARANDLVQATFERTYRSWSKARDGDTRAYARRILVNLRIDGGAPAASSCWHPLTCPTPRQPTTLPPSSPATRWSGHSRDSPSRNGAWSSYAICST